MCDFVRGITEIENIIYSYIYKNHKLCVVRSGDLKHCIINDRCDQIITDRNYYGSVGEYIKENIEDFIFTEA